ncbi:MAG TPA: hypothetical protein VK425_07190, partial [Acidimicrobiales bacterium]|nr:hypothetical protein [Acidimicrobiales bacterium]
MSPGAAEEGTAGAQVLLVGVGNPMRHDDGVGPLVVAQAVQLATGTDLVEALRIASPLVAPLDLLELWTDGDELSIVVDAVRSGAAPGELSLGYLGRPERAERLCPAAGAQLVVPGEGRRPSTHGLGVPDVYA